MQILAFPKYRDTRNPNIYNLNKHLEQNNDVSIHEFNIFKPFKKKYDIFHLHFPDYFFVKSFFYTTLRCIYFLTILGIFKIRGTKLVWTVHNLQPHYNYHPRLNNFIMSIWSRSLNGYIVMSEVSKKLVQEKYPALNFKDSEIIYHGLYDNYKNNVSKLIAKKKFGISHAKKVLLFIGNIKEYKNIPKLIEEFLQLDSKQYLLIIVGLVSDKKLKEKIESYNVDNLILNLKIFHDDDIQYYMNASDLVVLPFKNILNSGSVMLALSFKKPIFCPKLGSLQELSSLVGKNVINTYEKFSLKNISKIFKNLKSPDQLVLKQFDNKKLSLKLLHFYLKIYS